MRKKQCLVALDERQRGHIDGNKVQFTSGGRIEGTSLHYTYKGTFDGTRMTGDVDLGERLPGKPDLLNAHQQRPETLCNLGPPQLLKRLKLDLTDPLASQPENPGDLLQRVLAVIADSESHANHFLFV